MERVTETDIWINETYTHNQQSHATKTTKDTRNQNNKLWKRFFFSLSICIPFGRFSCFLYFYYLVVTIITYIAIRSDSFDGECLSWHYITRPYCLCHFYLMLCFFRLCFCFICSRSVCILFFGLVLLHRIKMFGSHTTAFHKCKKIRLISSISAVWCNMSWVCESESVWFWVFVVVVFLLV